MKSFRRWCAVLGLALFAPASPAMAQDGASCDGAPLIDMAQALTRKGGTVDHFWGRENLTVLPRAEGTEGPVLRIAYPEGSFGTGRESVRGGAGFELRQGAAPSARLSYRVRFPAGFDFIKGGKLPGLFGGDGPRGCAGQGRADGFSARLMWRTGAAGELYLYAPGRETECGASIGRGSWTFAPERWTTVMQRVSVKDPGAGTGSIEIWIDGRQVVRSDGLTLGSASSGAVDGLLFATFFGGGDESWASPEDQHADFADFRMEASQE